MQPRLPTAQRQSAIVAAAMRLACEAGPASVTTSGIAAAIGISQAAVFKHFPSKDAIWLAAMQWVRTALLDGLDAAARQAATPRDALAAMFRAHVDFAVAHPGVPRVIFHELQQPGDSPAKQAVRGLLQAYRQRLLGTLALAAQAGQVATGLDQAAAATSFVGLIQGLVMQSMLTGCPGTVRDEADRVLALYLRGLWEAA